MTTVDDKLKLFAKIVFERVEKDSEKKILSFTHNYDQIVEEEKKNILRQSENHIKQMKKKAENRRSQIISKATIDMQHMLLKKKKEIFDRTVADIKKLAETFTVQHDYIGFLEKCISSSLSQIDCEDVVLFFKPQDIDNYCDKIKEFVSKYKKEGMKVFVDKTDRDIIGGCICEDKGKTMRVDCSIQSLIEEKKSLIGKTLMDNLQ